MASAAPDGELGTNLLSPGYELMLYQLSRGLVRERSRNQTMAAEATTQRAGGGIIILGRVVGGITGLVAGGIAGVVCLWFFLICSPLSGIAGAIFGAMWGGRAAHALDPMGHGAASAVCRFAAGVLGGVAGGIAAAIVVSIVGVIGLVAVILGIAALFAFWRISVPVVVVLLIILMVWGRIRSRRGASEGGTGGERAARMRWSMDQWDDWSNW